VISCSYPGSAHVNMQLPNQDHSAYQVKDGRLFLAVSDGLGSCRYANIGSKWAADQITKKMMKHFEAGSSSGERGFKPAFVRCMTEIRDELEKAAQMSQVEPENSNISKKDFAATLLFALTDESNLFCAQIGDGGIYLVCESEVQQLFEPAKGEFSNITVPITHDQWKDYLSIKLLELPEDALFLCLMTDGFSDYIVQPESFFQRIAAEIRQRTVNEFEQWLDDLNEFYESKGFSDDDKTMSLIFFRELFKKQVK